MPGERAPAPHDDACMRDEETGTDTSWPPAMRTRGTATEQSGPQNRPHRPENDRYQNPCGFSGPAMLAR